MLMLRAAGVTKAFGSTPAVSGVDLELRAGEIRGLVGPNGAGKTTLLRLLFGLVRPDAGSVEVLGGPLYEAGIPAPGVAGFVEDPAFYPYLSGRANLELVRELDRGTIGPTIDDVLEVLGMGRRAGERVNGYSTGMRQRLGIAAALLRSPRLLLLDEPTSGLDPGGARDVTELLRELSDGGTAVLISSHHIGELETICDSYTMLRQGSVVWAGTATELAAQAPPSAYALITSDDARVVEIAAATPGVRAGRARDGTLAVAAREGARDALVVALVQEGVSIRGLRMMVSPLESMFFALTSGEVASELGPIELAERALAAS